MPDMKSVRRHVPVLLVTLVPLACLLPFANKAFHLDDPMFPWTARQIQTQLDAARTDARAGRAEAPGPR